jgi:hypothetical protein
MIEAAVILEEIAKYIALAKAGGEFAVDAVSMVQNLANLFGGTPAAVTPEKLAALTAEREALHALIQEPIEPEQD